jgi:methionyl aminopeptidase
MSPYAPCPEECHEGDGNGQTVKSDRSGKEVEREALRGGFYAIRNLCAHGVGRWLHEEPTEIANFFNPHDGRCFTEGLVVAMETFLAVGSDRVVEADNGWTLKTEGGSIAAQYEHTVVVTGRGPIIVTQD